MNFLVLFGIGNPEKYNQEEINPKTKTTFGFLYQKTLTKIKDIENANYNFIYIWD